MGGMMNRNQGPCFQQHLHAGGVAQKSNILHSSQCYLTAAHLGRRLCGFGHAVPGSYQAVRRRARLPQAAQAHGGRRYSVARSPEDPRHGSYSARRDERRMAVGGVQARGRRQAGEEWRGGGRFPGSR